MKYILIVVILFSFSYSDEIERIESILRDITELRKKYEISQTELNLKIINEKKQDKKILELENKIKVYKKQVKTKEKKVKKLKQQKICKPVKVKPIIIYKKQKLENPNKFPILMLKPQYIKYKKIRMKAKTYRLITQTDIYDAKYTKQIDTWAKNIAFTSNEKAVAKGRDTWIKVTGYFIKNSWVPAKTPMWLKAKYIKD